MSLNIIHSLQRGDTIGLIAPNEYINPKSAFYELCEQIKNRGFKVQVGNHVFDRYGSLAGTDANRAQDFQDMVVDPSIKGIFCVGFRWGTARILDELDWETIKAHPKWIMGWGETSSLLTPLAQTTAWRCLYGDPAEVSAHDHIWESFEKSLHAEPHTLFNPASTDRSAFLIYGDGEAEGTLCGGHLASMAYSLGTANEIQTEGRILYIDGSHIRPEMAERHLTALWLAGKLQGAKAIVVAETHDNKTVGDGNTFSYEEVLENRLPMLEKPILAGLPLQKRVVALHTWSHLHTHSHHFEVNLETKD